MKLQAQSLSFLSSDYENTSQKNFGFFGASVVSDKNKNDLIFLDLTGLYAMGQPTLSYLNFREIYFNYQIDNTSQLFFGRKINNWSSLESQWDLSFFNSQFKWNSLNPETQGLTGLFWERKEKFWKLSLFASPLYIPDQGPSYELKDGQFENTNPWFQTPPQNIRFQGDINLPIDYQINKPETSDVVFQTLYGAQIYLGESKGFYSQLSGLYKPANQLALGYQVVGVVNRVRVDLTPKVYSENNFAADFGYKDDWGQMQMSLLYSRPKSPTFDTGFNSPLFEESLSFGPSFQFNMKPVKLGLAYLNTNGGNIKEVGPDASGDRPSLSQRFLFRESFQIELGYSEIFNRSVKIDSAFQYRQSEKDDFKQIHFNQKVNLKGPWAFWADLILIDTSEESDSNFAPLRNLDQIFIGATYDI